MSEPPRMPTRPGYVAPAGACDAHTHVFQPGARLPQTPAYPPPDAPVELHATMRETLGLARGVLVQPSAYAGDHRVLYAALEKSGGTLRGVGLLDADADDEAFDALHAAGVRALRFVEARVPGTGRRYPGNISIDALPLLAPRMTERGWHAEIWAPLAEAAALCTAHAGCGVPIVFDHMAGATMADDPKGEAFATILAHVAAGTAWVKLVLCRTGPATAGYKAMRPFHDALLAANPERLLWGTDFPFIRMGDAAPDAGDLLDLFAAWTPDPAHREAILAGNPATLYDFPSAT